VRLAQVLAGMGRTQALLVGGIVLGLLDVVLLALTTRRFQRPRLIVES
jgi:hypothetical protein